MNNDCKCSFNEENPFALNQIIYQNENSQMKTFFLFFICVSLVMFVSSFYLNFMQKSEIKLSRKLIKGLNWLKNKTNDSKIPVDNDYTQTLLDI